MNKEDPTEKFLIPLGYRLLVRLDKVGATVIKTVTRETDGQEVDIHAPEKHREESRLGTVLAIGHKCEKHWRTGDRILVSFHVGTVIDLLAEGANDDTFRVINEDNIMGKLATKEEEEAFTEARMSRESNEPIVAYSDDV